MQDLQGRRKKSQSICSCADEASVCHSGISLSVWTGIREYLQSSHGRHQSGTAPENVCTGEEITAGDSLYGASGDLRGLWVFYGNSGKLSLFRYCREIAGDIYLCRICEKGTLGILFLANMFAGQTAKVLKCCNILLAGETLLLLITAASKMFLYIRSYGLTINRILPMVFMIWMGMVLISFVLRQRKRFPMVRICVLAGAVLFCILCVLPVQHLTELYNTWARMSGLIP